MPKAKRPTQPASVSPSFTPPYPPSWVDRVLYWVDQRPGPSWPYYLGLFGATALVVAAAHWGVGAYRPGTFDGLHVLTAAGLSSLFVLMSYFNRAVARALQDFRPVLAASEMEYEDLRYRLTTLPAWPGFWAGVGFLLFILGAALIDPQAGLTQGDPAALSLFGLLSGLREAFHFAPSAGPVVLGGLLVLLAWFAMGALAYQILRQLRIISDIYSRRAIVDLYVLAPLYAFSRHTARIAITLLMLTVLLGAVIPDMAQQRGALIVEGLFVVVAAGAFILPLSGVHRLLDKEKERMLAENGQMMKTTVAELHRSLAAERLTRMDHLNKALASLEIERAALVRIPTWPWAPETLRSVLAALLFPIVVWVIQFGLGRWLG